MTRVDFYILPDQAEKNRLILACRLAEKAFKQGHSIYIHTASEQSSAQLDELMWTFRQGSFVPHQLATADGEPAPVLIGHQQEAPESQADVLLNMTAEVPLFFSRFQRVAELVNQADEIRAQARTRFKFYRDRGYPMHTHNL
ncbi:MAG TPA: DNA polymerase III subunit chi [Gammaproteobacteria bacterium]|nr:DNA polymerase III subunit chi [Gammaproteobacteria bacterium]